MKKSRKGKKRSHHKGIVRHGGLWEVHRGIPKGYHEIKDAHIFYKRADDKDKKDKKTRTHNNANLLH